MAFDPRQIEDTVSRVAAAFPAWSARTIAQRGAFFQRLIDLLGQRREALAQLVTDEIGKILTESRAEIDKCVFVCQYYRDHAERFLADAVIDSDAPRSVVLYQSLGTVLAIMPWNFPFWQVFRFAVPALMAGNTALLKHASIVPRCAAAAEQLFIDAGFPRDVFRILLVRSTEVDGVIADERVKAVAFTGSEAAGRKVAALAGANLKKCVLELGGSDPFVVLADADLERAVAAAVQSRMFTSAQSCINAKRFIVAATIADAFVDRLEREFEGLVCGDPCDERTRLGPLARADLRDKLHDQVQRSLAAGAVCVTGCRVLDRPGFFYAPSILDQVGPGMPVYAEETFGPVAAIVRAQDDEHALQLANDTRYGLGASIWTRNVERGEALARRIEAGMVYVNGVVKSDPRLPFGGIKASGYGRELSREGIREFVNIKTVSTY